MRPAEDLHSLILSLNKAEKRYFRLFASRYDTGGNSNYEKLFNAIEGQEVYNEPAIKKLFAGETFIKHLPSEKNYLYNLVLDSLFMHYSSQGKEARSYKKLQQAHLLLDRGLVEQCVKALKRIKKVVYEAELFELLLECLRLEKQIISRRSYSSAEENSLEVLHLEEKECLARLEESNEYWLLFSKFYRLHYRSGSSRDEQERQKIEELMQHPLLQDQSRPQLFRTRLDFMHIHALYQFIKGNHAVAAAYNKQYLELLESRPEQLKMHHKRYLATLNNYLMDCLGMGEYSEVAEGITKMRALPAQFKFYNTSAIDNDIFRLTLILELNYLIKTGKFQQGMYKVLPMVQELAQREEHIARHNLLVIYYLLAYLHFGAGRYAVALKWLNRIINETDESVMQDIHAFARIFSLIVHYELDNTDILDHLYTGAYRYLNRKKKKYGAEALLLKYMRKLPDITDRQELLETFRRLKAELQVLADDPQEKRALDYFDLIAWLDSKLNRTSFAQEVQLHAASGASGAV